MSTKKTPEAPSAETQPAAAKASPQAGTARAPRNKDAQAKPTAGSAEALEQGLADLQGLADEYYGRLADTAAKLNTQAGALYKDGVGYVRSHPGGTFMGAFALGVLFGVLMGRR